MPAYTQLTQMLAGVPAAGAQAVFDRELVPYLVDVWVEDYTRSHGRGDIVATSTASFSYLFDIASGRLIAAWGISQGRHGEPRDRARMAGHPLGAGPAYHRGHAIPHTLGGPTDINLVPQRGSVNVGPFRVLEKLAVANPGSLYFTYWLYARGADQVPTGVEQGLLIPGRLPDIRRHRN